MLSNPHSRFLAMLPARPLQVGTVLSIDAGVAVVELPGGGRLQARGVAGVGDRVFVRDGVIESEAPDLTYISGEV